MKLEFEYENEVISFNVIKRRRKTMCIKIEEGGDVTVIVPLAAEKEYILMAVKNKASWIIMKQEEIRKVYNKKIRREAVEGATFMYLGKEYPLHIVFDKYIKNITVELNKSGCDELKSNKLFIDKHYCNSNNKIIDKSQNVFLNKTDLNNKFIIHTNTLEQDRIKLVLEKWYRTRTLEIVKRKIDYYQINFKDKVTDIKVKEQKRRWASCTGKNAILFNWRCSMVREDVLDYIVVHEMCHIDHKNHSKNFWNRVEELMPDYREKHEWLKVNGINITI